MKMTPKAWLTLAFTLVTLWFLQESFSLSNVASFIPRITLSLTIFLLIIQLILDVKTGDGSSPFAAETVAANAESDWRLVRKIPAWLAIFWMSGLLAALLLFGLVAGSSVFCLVFMKWHASESWKTSLLFAIMLGLGIQLVFSFIFGITLYGGALAEVLP